LRNLVHRTEEGLLALILGAMTVLTFVQVVLRYVFNTGLLWALEATTYMFGWLVLIGLSYGVRKHAHIGIDALVKKFPRDLRRIVGLIVVVLALVYAGIMLYGGYGYVRRLMILGVEAQDIPVERWILNLSLPIGFGLLFIRLLQMGWRIATGKSSGYELADEAAAAIKDLSGDGIPDATEVAR
jgi:C4-dicarboxylate transporter DctQ subunit